MKSFIFGFLLIFCQTEAAENNANATKFECFHGESFNAGQNFIKIECPSKLCIMFVSSCRSYWATTCYDEMKPMAIFDTFKHAKEVYNNSLYSNFLYCKEKQSLCNNSTQNMFRLLKYANNFDSILWPKIRKEAKPILENIVFSYMYPDQYISFYGQTFNTTKKVWIKYNFGTFKDLKFVIDFVNSKIDAELINSTEKDTGSLKLKQQFIPGQIINFTISTIISKNESLPNFYVNGEFLNFTFPGRLNSFRYGGDWQKINTTKKDSYYPLSEIASSFEYAKPKSQNSKIFCDENFIKSFKPKFSLNYTAFEVSTDFSPSFIIDMFGPNETIEYELRESLCPNTFTTKIQIEIFQNSSGNFYITPQYDAKKIENCSFFLIHVMKTGWNGSCQNSSYSENTLNYKFSPTFGGSHNGNIKYFVQGPKRKLIC